MKFTAAISLFFTTIASAVATKYVELPDTVDASSPLGQSVISQARKLEGGDEVDYTWVSGYSLKFQGCHHVTQWNAEADGEEDVRIATKRLIRFRLCPTGSCDGESAGGCNSGYGDYIVDMDTYLAAYVTNKQAMEEYNCEYLEANVCGCDDDDGKDDGFDQEQCLYDCYYNNGADYCIEAEADDGAAEAFDLADWVVCAQFDAPNDDGGRRLDAAEEVQYFIGPYCADQGGDVVLGMFFDDTCSTFADSYGGKTTYKSFMGTGLPYSESSILGLECLDCKEPADANNDGDQADEDMVTEMCEMMYATAGKCETYLGNNDANENACNYLKGVKVIRSDGVMEAITSGSSTAAIFIGVFAAAFFLVGGYAYYLKTKLEKINLSS